MRAFVVLAAILLAATTASAGPALPVGYSLDVTEPSAGCGTCVGAEAAVYTVEPAGCYDCGGVGAAVGAQHDGDGTTASAKVCRGGFVYICPVDVTL